MRVKKKKSKKTEKKGCEEKERTRHCLWNGTKGRDPDGWGEYISWWLTVSLCCQGSARHLPSAIVVLQILVIVYFPSVSNNFPPCVFPPYGLLGLGPRLHRPENSSLCPVLVPFIAQHHITSQPVGYFRNRLSVTINDNSSLVPYKYSSDSIFALLLNFICPVCSRLHRPPWNGSRSFR